MLFRSIAYASPLLLGFALPFVLSLGKERGWERRHFLGAAPVAALALILILFVTWTFSGEPILRFLELSCFLLAFGTFLFGLFHLALGLGLPPIVAQIAVCCVVVLMMGTLYYFEPIREQAVEAKLPREALQKRIDIAMNGNPYVVVAMSIFEVDLLHRGTTALRDLEPSWPRWPVVALDYVVFGFFAYVAYLGAVALRLRKRA